MVVVGAAPRAEGCPSQCAECMWCDRSSSRPLTACCGREGRSWAVVASAFARRQSGATRSACGLRRRRVRFQRERSWGSVIGPGRAAEDGSGLVVDSTKVGVVLRKRAGNYHCATRIETACKRLWYSICTYCTGARPLLSRHSRARNQQKGNTRARQPVATRPWPREQPRPPRR